ncbi:hypothetical protein GGR57DRAFT_474006 [Xylariaceae sp. FL1272]|nr:hypothetical protein GGR57DRAFT_474006 [Xylariaceae sp. FL1272]
MCHSRSLLSSIISYLAVIQSSSFAEGQADNHLFWPTLSLSTHERTPEANVLLIHRHIFDSLNNPYTIFTI